MKLLIFLGLVLSMAGKISAQATKNANTEQLKFAEFCNGCGSGFEYNLFLIKNGKLYSQSDRHHYDKLPMPNQYYLLAKNLLDSLPRYLLANNSVVWGCPDCYDQGGIAIFYTCNGKKYHWKIDTNVSEQPEEIRPYIEKMSTVIGKLQKTLPRY